MAEPEYPRAWGVLIQDELGYSGWDAISDDQDIAEEMAEEIRGASVVELIPRPTVDRLIAEAVAAERERCAGIAEFWRYELSEEGCDDWALATRIADKIREVPS
jgi:hypothetical protein